MDSIYAGWSANNGRILGRCAQHFWKNQRVWDISATAVNLLGFDEIYDSQLASLILLNSVVFYGVIIYGGWCAGNGGEYWILDILGMSALRLLVYYIWYITKLPPTTNDM